MSAAEAFQSRVTNILTVDLQLDVPDAETDLIEEGILDSLVFVDLISRLEEEFNFEIDLGELEFEEFSSISRIVNYVTSSGGVLPEANVLQ